MTAASAASAASPTSAAITRPRTWDRRLVVAVLCIAAMAAGLRSLDLGTNPPELFEDELSGAVSAWTVVTTGHDVGRTLLPFLVTRLEVKQPLYFYATVPFQAAFGDGPVAVRIPAVLFGTAATLLAIWLLTVFGASTGVALAGGFLFAISPWAIHYSRAGWEPAAFLPFGMGGLGLLWVGLREHRRRIIVAAAVVLAVGAYTYHPALLLDVVLPAALVAIVAFRSRTLTRQDVIDLAIGAAVAIVILIPYGLAISDPLFLSRTRDLSVFRDGFTFQTLNLAWGDYWAQWSPAYLLGGTAPNPRINPGLLVYAWTVPFFLVGLDRLIHRRRPEDLLLLAWLVLGPLPAALADDKTTPHAARGLDALPAIILVTAIGLGRAWTWLRDRVDDVVIRAAVVSVVVVAMSAGFVSFYQTYYGGPYVVRSANWWGYGSGAALRLMGSAVPPGATVCVAENDISQFTFLQQMRYYVPNPAFHVVEGVKSSVCQQPGTYVLARVDRALDVAASEVGVVNDITGQPFFHLVQVTGPAT